MNIILQVVFHLMQALGGKGSYYVHIITTNENADAHLTHVH